MSPHCVSTDSQVSVQKKDANLGHPAEWNWIGFAVSLSTVQAVSYPLTSHNVGRGGVAG
jgi:hypothetical protein